MAVKLILVSLVLVAAVCSTGSLAQQSEETGGKRLADRRTQLLKRFQSRRKVEKSLNNNRRKITASEDDLEKRRQLFQRNPLRGRKPANSRDNEIFPAKSSTRTSSRIVPTTRPTLPPRNIPLEVDPTVERISNSDRDIQSLVLQNTVDEKEEAKPFIGISEVKPISNPSGFRSSNEQIVRISFKMKPTTAAPEIIEENEATLAPIRKFFRTKFSGKQFTRPTSIKNDGNERNNIALGKNKALQALLKTASETEATSLPEVFTDAPQVKNMPVEVKAAMREMEEDNQKSRQGSPRKLNALLKRVNRFRGRSRGRGNNRIAPKSEEDIPAKETPRRITNFRSFPQKNNRDRVRGSFPARRLNNVRVQQTTRKPSPTLPRFNEIDVPTPVPIATPPIIEDFKPRTETVEIEIPEEEIYPGGKEKFFEENGIFLTLEDAEEEAMRRNQEVLRSLQNQFSNEAPRSQQTFQTPTAQFQPTNTNQFQQQQPTPIQQSAPLSPRINSASQSRFGLLNTNNFQSFDAQFGGAVPVNPGAANLNSNIFTRPQIQSQQGLPVQSSLPQQPIQQQQQQQPVFNVPSSRFLGHPADNIDLNTGSFSLNTGK